MTVAFRFPSSRHLDLIGFGWSPLLELVLSLPVITHPKRTPMHLPWARRCRDLPPDLLAGIHALTGSFDGFIPGIFEVGLLGNSPSFDDEMAAFRQLDHDTFAYEMSLPLGGFGCSPDDDRGPELLARPEYRDEVVAAARSMGEDHGELAVAMFEDPGGVQERMANMLEWYWAEAFEAEWDRIRPRIEAEVTDGARALVTRGIPGLVEELLPEGRWDPDCSCILVDRPFQRTVEVADRGRMLFIPTVFGWPRVLIELSPPWPVSIMVPLRDLRQPQVPLASDHEVADGMRALGDETRLQIARMVAEQPRSTKELAELLKLSDSAVSRHLKILDAAGIVQGRRDGYFVLYSLRPTRISQLGGALRRTLGLLPSTSSGVPPLPVTVSRASTTQRDPQQPGVGA